MSNLINRQYAIDALDEIRHVLDRKEKELTILPSAEPEIIRCKDCKWWGRKDTYKDGSSMIVCKKGRSANLEGFCHYAEMREGEQE